MFKRFSALVLTCLLVLSFVAVPAMAASTKLDTNGDGAVDTDDAVYLLLHVMFGLEDYPIAGTYSDFNGDGTTDTNDAVYLLLHVMFGSEDYPIAGAPSWNGSGGNTAGRPATFTVAANKTEVVPGDTITVTVSSTKIANCSNVGVSLLFDENMFEIVARSGKVYTTGAMSGADPKAGKVNFFSQSLPAPLGAPFTVEGTVFEVELKVKYTAVGSSTISMAAAQAQDGAAVAVAAANTVTIKVKCEHIFGAWEKADATNHKRTCTKCGEVMTESHKWDAGTVTTPADCKNPGEKTFTCVVCGEKKVEQAIGSHNYDNWVTSVSATCVASGKKIRTCMDCGHVETQIVPATGVHIWDAGVVAKAPTCVNAGVKTLSCTLCGEAKTEVIPATGVHTYGSWQKHDADTHQQLCAVCGNVQTENHAWDAGKVTRKPTCTTEGVTTYTCSVCSETRTEAIVTTGHTYTDDADTICNICDGVRIIYTISAGKNVTWRKDTVTVTVNASQVENCNSFGLAVLYDPTVFEFLGGSCNGPAGMISGVEKKEAGKLHCYWAAQEPQTISGQVFTLEFKVWDTATPGQTVITTEKPSAEVQDTAIDGLSNQCGMDVLMYQPGNVDGDDTLTTRDAVYLLLHVMFGGEDYPIDTVIVLDMNGDGKLSSSDAVYLLLHVMFGAEDYPI